MSETKSAKTKLKIIEAGIQILTQNPSASMEEIANSIDLNRRTLHRYFNGKSDLLEEITQYASTVCLQSTKDCISSSVDPFEQLKAMFYSDIKSGRRFQFLYAFHASPSNIEEESEVYKEMMELFRNVLKQLRNSGIFPPETSIKWIENFYISTITAAVTTITSGISAEDEIADLAWTSFSHGIIGKDRK